MFLAVQGNKQLTISENEQDLYLNLGYDIVQVNGEEFTVIQESPAKTVPYAKHKEALDKVAMLEAENADLKQQLEQENEDPKQQLEEKKGKEGGK
jgi:hypothetical protein